MQLDTFEKDVSPKILERGRGCFRDGAVGEIFTDDGVHYEAQVEGGEYYDVEAHVAEGGDILGLACDCPYDWGDVCKHGVAVLLAVREQRKQEASLPKKIPVKKPELRAVLLAQSKEALADELLSLAAQDRTLRQSLLLRFGDSADELEGSRKLVRQSMSKRRFWEYGTVDEALEGAWVVLDRAKDCEESEPERAIKLCLVVLPEAVELTQYCDDSNGEVGEVFAACTATIKAAVSAIREGAPRERWAAISEILLCECENPVYHGWGDIPLEFYEALLDFGEEPALRDALSGALERERQSSQGEHGRYHNEAVAKLQLELLRRGGEPGEADRFLAASMDFPGFRKQAIADAMKREEYAIAARLAEEGMARDGQYPGLVHQWRTALYQACEAMDDRPRVLELAKYFVLYEHEGLDYYPVFKKAYSQPEWPTALAGLLAEFEAQSDPGRVYVEVLLEEREYDRLLAYIKKHPNELVGLARHFPVGYHEDLSNRYRQPILRRAEQAGNRSGYKDVCQLLRSFGGELGDDRMREVIGELQAAYPRRPAFRDELRKVRS